GVAGIKQEQSATILQDEASAFYRDAGTEGVVQALNERGYISVFVHGGQVSRVAPGGRATGGSAVCLRGINHGRALFGIVFCQQSLDRHFCEARVSVVAKQI